MSAFATTQWSRVLAAGGEVDTQAREALAWLCKTYWYPLYLFVRHRGYAPDDAADLTQEFFAYLLEKEVVRGADPAAGRFRSFLLGTLKNYLSHRQGWARAQKRGGTSKTISLDGGWAEERYVAEPLDELTPEGAFQRRWALTVLERSLERLGRRQSEAGAFDRFERLRRYLTGERPAPPYAEVAEELGMNENAVRGAVLRLRRQLGALLREEVAETVSSPEDVDDEIRYLLGVVNPWEPASAAS